MNKVLTFPGFIDVHVHFRDPGVPEAETTASGLEAARRGGFAAVVTMPNTTPACDSPEWMDYQRKAAQCAGAGTLLLPSACITKGRLGREVADLESLAEAGAAFFTDDGSYVADDKVMEEAMRRAAALGMCICEHAMDPKEVKGWRDPRLQSREDSSFAHHSRLCRDDGNSPRSCDLPRDRMSSPHPAHFDSRGRCARSRRTERRAACYRRGDAAPSSPFVRGDSA